MRNYFSNIIFTRQILCVLLLILVLVPTFFIHSQKYPDWGDDFAQYIYQSQHIHSSTESYKQVLNIEEYSSQKRSVFFSVILSVATPTLHIQNYVDVISITYIVAALCFFLFLTSHFSLAISFVTTLAVFYNFLFLRLKSEVVPEFVFMALFYGVLYLTTLSKKWPRYVIPILLGLLISVRFVGLSLVLAYVLFLMFNQDKTTKQKVKEVVICVLIFSSIIILINTCLLSSIQNQELKLYSSIVANDYHFNTISENVSIYSRYLTLFFEQEIPYWINSIITVFVFTFFLIGFIFSLLKKRNILHFSFISYFLFLFFYPYNADTIKYLIPIVPLLFYFIIVGLKLGFEKINLKYQNTCIVICLSIVFLSNTKTIWLSMKHIDTSIGPYETSVLQDFEKIKTIVTPSENIAFGKPFIINLLAKRDAYFLSQKNYRQVLQHANFVLLAKQHVNELYPKTIGIEMSRGDTTELNHFYLIKL